MTVEIIKADLFSMRVDALAHGVNCEGKMGKGIAVGFKQRWPEMFESYQKDAARFGRYFNNDPYYILGRIHLWQREVTIANLFIQHKAIPNQAKYWALEQSLIEFAYWIGTKWTLGNPYDKYKHIKSIAMPWIGCGIGGLHKYGVEAIVRHVFDDWQGVVYICEVENE